LIIACRFDDPGFQEVMVLFVDLHAKALSISLLKKENKLRNVLKSEFTIMQSSVGIDMPLNLKPAITCFSGTPNIIRGE
jgi:hypothetical protein